MSACLVESRLRVQLTRARADLRTLANKAANTRKDETLARLKPQIVEGKRLVGDKVAALESHRGECLDCANADPVA